MTQSMSRTANCYDNATMESFWASLKAEAFRFIPATHAQARLLIHDYIDAFYNTHRLHSSLNFQSPLDFERILRQSLRPYFPGKITSIEIGLLLNFGSDKLQFKRKHRTYRPRRS